MGGSWLSIRKALNRRAAIVPRPSVVGLCERTRVSAPTPLVVAVIRPVTLYPYFVRVRRHRDRRNERAKFTERTPGHGTMLRICSSPGAAANAN